MDVWLAIPMCFQYVRLRNAWAPAPASSVADGPTGSSSKRCLTRKCWGAPLSGCLATGVPLLGEDDVETYGSRILRASTSSLSTEQSLCWQLLLLGQLNRRCFAETTSSIQMPSSAFANTDELLLQSQSQLLLLNQLCFGIQQPIRPSTGTHKHYVDEANVNVSRLMIVRQLFNECNSTKPHVAEM